jgi:hypothetical protein
MRQERPEITTNQILEWADNYHNRTGKWPDTESGPIPEALGTTWRGVDMALRRGYRGLPGKSSLCRLLHERRGLPPRWCVMYWKPAGPPTWSYLEKRRVNNRQRATRGNTITPRMTTAPKAKANKTGNTMSHNPFRPSPVE